MKNDNYQTLNMPEETGLYSAQYIHRIAASAAHLLAAMMDKIEGIDAESLSIEVRDSLEALGEDLAPTGYLTPYQREDGSIGIW